MFIAAQSIIAKCGKQPKCPSVNEWIKKLWYITQWNICSREEEGAPTLCDSMGGTGEHYAKGNKPGGEGQIPYDLTCKRNLMNETNKIEPEAWKLGTD